jgi:hypothetical protein
MRGNRRIVVSGSNRRILSWCTAVVAVVSLAAPSLAYVRPARVTQVDVTPAGTSPHGCAATSICEGVFPEASMSADGRYVAFASGYAGLVAGDLGVHTEVYLRDLHSGRTELVSRGMAGAPAAGTGNAFCGDGQSTAPQISADGRYVAFMSVATNLVSGVKQPGVYRIYLFDRRTGELRLVSTSSPDTAGTACGATYPSISADGRYVSFTSDNPNEVSPPVNNGHPNVFVRDLRTGKTVLVNVQPDGKPSGTCTVPPASIAATLGYCLVGTATDYPRSSISASGRWVVFDSEASDLIPGGTTNHTYNVYVRDLTTHSTQLVSVAPGGAEPNQPPDGGATLDPSPGSEIAYYVPPYNYDWVTGNVISADGRYVLYVSEATNLVPNDTDGFPADPQAGLDAFVYDRVTGRTVRVSVDSAGGQLINSPRVVTAAVASEFSLSANGRYVTFDDNGGGPGNADVGVLRYDLVTGTLDLASRADNGIPDQAIPAAISADGSAVLFAGCFDVVDQSQPPTYACNSNNIHLYVENMGPDLGNGGLAASGRLTVAGDPGFGASGIASGKASGTLGQVLAPAGADLIRASAAYRAQEQDLFIREELQTMPTVVGTPTVGSLGIVYGFDVTALGVRYQVRAQRAPGPDYDPAGGASFGLFRQGADGLWTQIAALHGGYGTTGNEVVFALPLREIGLQTGGRLSGLRAFTAAGSYLTGAVKVLDEIGLSR